MDYFDLYKKRVSTFKDFNGISRVSMNSKVIINEIQEKAVQIVDDSDTKDQKVIKVVDYILKNGDIIEWQSDKWINIVTDNMADIYYRGVLRRCNGSLKWVDTQGEINERFFTFKSDPATNFGIEDGKIISIGNERRTLLVNCDDDTRLFKRDQRFIFDSRAWKITAIDNISMKNISIVTLEEDLINTAQDNLELEIADYHGNIANYVITINNGSFVTISDDQSLQLNVIVTNNNSPMPSPTLSYASSDETIATVSSDGTILPLTLGTVIITVTHKDKSAQIEVNITHSTAYSYTCEIIGSDEIKVGRTQTYSAKFYRNGIEYSQESTFMLTGDDDTSTTKLASISGQDSVANTCRLVAASTVGYVKLHVVGQEGLSKVSKRIKIKPLY